MEEELLVLPNNSEELNEAFDALVAMAIDLIQPFVKGIDEAREALATTSLAILEASDALDDSMKKLDELQESPESTSRLGTRNTRVRRSALNYNAMHNGRPFQETLSEEDKLQQQIIEL